MVSSICLCIYNNNGTQDICVIWNEERMRIRIVWDWIGIKNRNDYANENEGQWIRAKDKGRDAWNPVKK